MPIFEYVCSQCGFRFEKLQNNASEQQAECPNCKSCEVKRELSAFSSPGSSDSKASCFSGG